MDRMLGTFEQGHIVFDTPAPWPDGSRVEVSLVTPGAGGPQGEPPPGVRSEFWCEFHNENTVGFNLADAFWPLTTDETKLILDHMDASEPLDLSPAEVDRMEAAWKESKEQQKELVRQSWANDEAMFK